MQADSDQTSSRLEPYRKFYMGKQKQNKRSAGDCKHERDSSLYTTVDTSTWNTDVLQRIIFVSQMKFEKNTANLSKS